MIPSNKKQLLKEFFSLCPDGICDVSLLTEDEKRQVRDNNTMFLTGIIQRADAENGNGRIYEKSILEREINNYQQLIRERRALGTLDHEDESTISLKNVSHIVVETFWKRK